MISVIVPIYNSEKYLRDCLLSIANQTYDNLEVILINDGSTDSSKNICEEFCSRYSNFRLINKPNGGQMSSWLLALEYVSGEFIGFVDSDDLIADTFFEKMAIAQKKHDADLVMCSRQIFNDGDLDGLVVQKLSKNGFFSNENAYSIKMSFLPTFEGNLSQARWDKLFRTSIFKECAKRYCNKPVRTFEDRFIVIPYVFYSSSFEFLDEPLYICRIVKNSSSKKYRPELCDIADLLFEKHLQLINDLNIYDSCISRIELEKIDVLRAIFERNVCCAIPNKEKYIEAKKILSRENRIIVTKHKKQCVGKFGKFFYICSKLYLPHLLVLGGILFGKKHL